MARIKGGANAKKRHNRVLKLAKGYYGARSKQYRIAKQSVMRALTSAYAPYDVVSRYQTSASGNFINYSNSEVDKLLTDIPLTADEKTRTDLYHKVLKHLTDDACSVYIQDPTTITAVSTRLEGYYVYPMYVQDMSQVKLVQK